MSTTIDNLQIEIKSSSVDAAQGIDALAKSLGNLKKSGTISTAVKNLNNLSASLRNLPNVHGSSNALRTLANSVEKLKSVGSISTLTNSLSKLPTALKSLSGINLEKTKSQLEGVADAVSPLSTLKAGGLSTMVNAMKNLGKVADSLDDDTIGRFASKVELLTQKLSPLSEKMATIKAGFNAINSSARSASRSVEDFGDGIDVASLNMSSFIDVARTVVDAIMNVVRTFTEFMHDATQWDGIEYQFGNAFGEQADVYYEKITQITDALKINKQMFMENSAMAASMLIGFGVNEADAREMGLGYTELAYDIWAAYNNVYKTLDGADGAMAAVRSAIAGEVEPIRRAGFTIVESQLEQTAANHGLEISIESATEAQKSYLRYLELVDQAHSKGIVGTYASEMETAEGMLRTLKQEWVSLTQSFASLFIPVLVKVLPYIQAFVDLLKEGVYWLAELLGVEIQAVDFSDYKTGSNALENIENSANGATGALEETTKAAKELKNATVGIDELNVISPNSATGSNGSGGGAGDGAGSSGFEGIGSLWDEAIFDGIQNDVDAIKEKMRGWLPVIASIASGLAGLRLMKLLSDIDAIEKTKLFKGKIKGITGWVSAFTSLAKEGGVIATLAAAFPKLSTAISGVGTALAGITAPVWIGIAAAVAALASAVYFVVENWDELKRAVKDFFAENIGPKLESIKGHFDKIKESFEPITTMFRNFFESDFWHKTVEVLGKIVEGFGALVFAILTFTQAGAIKALFGVFEGIVEFISGAAQQIAGWFDVIVGIFTLDGEKIKEGTKKIISGIVDAWKGLYSMTIGAIVDFFTGVVDWFTKLWDVLVGHSIVPDTINAIVKWFTSLPSKIFGSIEKFVTGIVDKFKGLWSKLVSWWNGKTKLKEYTPSIGSIYDKLKPRWDNAREWWNNKKSAMKTYTPSIGSIYEKVYDRWKNARDWWNSKKGSFKTYTPSIGSITDKLKSAWNSAKSWWSKNVKLSTKLNISVPTIKVKWETASAFGKSFKYPTGFSLKFAADGGIFDQGSLIWAGERGPEVMANASGGRTGVMNIEQMQEAVYEGVYSAMIAAMRGNSEGGGQDIRVYLDSREITASVERRQRERGASIMGNQVYSY